MSFIHQLLKTKFIFIFALFIAVLLIIFHNQVFFYFQVYRLKDHLARSVPCTSGNKMKEKLCAGGFYSKVWAHRVDSYERFIFLSKSFSGFEIDLVYDESKKIFDVGHPPAASIGLSFEKILQDKASAGKFFWLDLKNLSDGNSASVLDLLKKLDGAYHISNRVLVESDNIRALASISDAGYLTSFYYDTGTYEEFIHNSSAAIKDSIFAKIDAVSQDVIIYDTLVKRFPTKARLTWALSASYYLSDSMFSSLDKDDKLLIYLVNIKSPGYR